MKVSVKIVEISNLFKEKSDDTSVYAVIKHSPEDYSAETDKVSIKGDDVVFESNNEFNFDVESTTEPVVITVLSSNDEEIASYPIGLTDFSDGVKTEKVFDLIPAEGYPENGKIKLVVLVNKILPKVPQNKPAPKPQKAPKPHFEEEELDEEESAEEIKAGRTQEERNRDKAALLGLEYDEIYEKAREEAQERYKIILDANANILLENENWINEYAENDQNENSHSDQ